MLKRSQGCQAIALLHCAAIAGLRGNDGFVVQLGRLRSFHFRGVFIE